MNNLDLIIQIILMIIGSGALGYGGTWLQKHHKATHFANGLSYAQQLANWSVARVATDSRLAMGQRRTAVVRELQTVLDKHGYHFSVNRLMGLAEFAYQIYKSNGHKIVAPVKTPAPTVDNTTDGPVNNNKVEYKSKNELTGDEIKVLNDYRAKKAANK